MKVLVVAFERLPAGFLGCCGNEWIETPAFDRLAADAVTFDRHLVEHVDLAATRHAWSSGRYEFARAARETDATTDDASVFARLTAAGVATSLLVELPRVEPSRLAEGFTHVAEVEGEDGLDADPDETPFAQLAMTAVSEIDRLQSSAAKDWLLWLDARGVPEPWLAPREFAGMYVLRLEQEADADDGEPDDAESASAAAPTSFEAALADAAIATDDDEDDDSLADPGEAAWPEFDEEDEAETDEELAQQLAEEAAELDELLRTLSNAARRERAARSGESGKDAASRTLTTDDWRYVRALYGGFVTFLDRWLGTLLDEARRRIDADELLVIVTAAHGASLGERAGLSGTQAELGEETLRTPLLVLRPTDSLPGRRRALVQPVDLALTLLEAFGVAATNGSLDGRTLWPLIRGEAVAHRDAAFFGGPAADGAGFVAGMETADFRLLRLPSPTGETEPELRLHQLPSDPWDALDVSRQFPAETERLTQRLAEFLAGSEP